MRPPESLAKEKKPSTVCNFKINSLTNVRYPESLAKYFFF